MVFMDILIGSDRNKEIISLVRRTSVTSKSLVRDSPHLSNKIILSLLGRSSYFDYVFKGQGANVVVCLAGTVMDHRLAVDVGRRTIK